MIKSRDFQAEVQLDQIAGYALLGGAVLSFVLTGLGVVVLAFRGLPQTPLIGQPIASALRSAVHLNPAGIVNLGVLVLLATPLLRVLIAIVGFAALRWWRFAAVSAIVLVMLLLSFFVFAR